MLCCPFLSSTYFNPVVGSVLEDTNERVHDRQAYREVRRTVREGQGEASEADDAGPAFQDGGVCRGPSRQGLGFFGLAGGESQDCKQERSPPRHGCHLRIGRQEKVERPDVAVVDGGEAVVDGPVDLALGWVGTRYVPAGLARPGPESIDADETLVPVHSSDKRGQVRWRQPAKPVLHP